MHTHTQIHYAIKNGNVLYLRALSLLFVLSNSYVFLSYHIILHFVLFYYCSLETCLSSNKRQKGSGSEMEGKRVGTGRSRDRGNLIQNILCEKKNSIFKNKEKTRKHKWT